MIIETRDDVVRLSGLLQKNQWLTIKAAANLLLHDHPQGIIVDCARLENVTEEGAQTFLEAMRDIESVKARIVVANLPENVMAVLRTVPGVRSQLPIANSVDAARASLRVAARPTNAPASQRGGDGGGKAQILLVPLLARIDLTYGAHLAARLARAGRSEVRLVFFLEIARNLPVNAPLPEQEQSAVESLERAQQYARQFNITASEHVERVRDATEGILAAIRNQSADLVVVGAANEPEGNDNHDAFHNLVDSLLHRAQAEVVIGRLKPNT